MNATTPQASHAARRLISDFGTAVARAALLGSKLGKTVDTAEAEACRLELERMVSHLEHGIDEQMGRVATLRGELGTRRQPDPDARSDLRDLLWLGLGVIGARLGVDTAADAVAEGILVMAVGAAGYALVRAAAPRLARWRARRRRSHFFIHGGRVHGPMTAAEADRFVRAALGEVDVRGRRRAMADATPRSSAPARAGGETPTRYDQVPDGCWIACIAGLTGLPHDDLAALIPRLDDGRCDGSRGTEYHNAVNAYLRASGWRIERVGPDVPQGYAIGSGTSPRAGYHAVIVKDGVTWHDPHPSRAGIAKLDSFEVLIPLTYSPAMESLDAALPSAFRDALSPEQQRVLASRFPRPVAEATTPDEPLYADTPDPEAEHDPDLSDEAWAVTKREMAEASRPAAARCEITATIGATTVRCGNNAAHEGDCWFLPARPVAADGGASAGAEIPEDIALALSDLQRESRAVGEYGYGPDRGRFEREEAKARAECDAEIRSALSAARAQAAEATAERERLRNLLEAVYLEVAHAFALRADLGDPSWARLVPQYGGALRAIQQYVAEFDPFARAALSPASSGPTPEPTP
jgi:hypothetical protein